MLVLRVRDKAGRKVLSIFHSTSRPLTAVLIHRERSVCSASAIVLCFHVPNLVFPHTLSDDKVDPPIPPRYLLSQNRPPLCLPESGKHARGYLASAIVHPTHLLDDALPSNRSLDTKVRFLSSFLF